VSGLRVEGSRFRVQRFRGSGLKGSGLRVQGRGLMGSGVRIAVGLKSGQLNRKRNSQKANVEYRIMNIEVMYSVYFIKKD
jgi:hypothetical protein